MQDALETSRTIGVALGILMGQSTVSRADAAFEILSKASQRSNVESLRDLADQIVEHVRAALRQGLISRPRSGSPARHR